ncbi:O-antigen ligase family protein [Roseospirillum parvum]|uniref:O-antigen ligase n=1 Tax=Roseospirillum parvum TaxID=83401 RepID=A0A1G8BVS3_9PROT|nr:O-antigen ligase family protein [Roseospirillum parvum]SDH37285.1 O-antigen ligase [Roseospirillum parvum]
MTAPGAPTWLDRLAGGLLFALPTVAYVAHHGLVWLVPLLGLYALWRSRPDGPHPLAVMKAAWPLLALLALALASALWSPDPGYTLSRALRLAVEMGFGLLLLSAAPRLPEALRRRAVRLLAAGLAVGDVILLANLGLDGAVLAPFKDAAFEAEFINRVSGGLALNAVLVVPLALLLVRLRHPAAGLGLVALHGLTVVLFANLSAKLAVLIAVTAALFGLFSGRLARWLLLVPVLIALFLPLALPVAVDQPPLCSAGWVKSSILHRLQVWNFTRARIDEAPLFGHGLEAARLMPEGRGVVYFYTCQPDGSDVRTFGWAEALPLHPHNGFLQVWLEMGLAGALLVSAGLIQAARATWRTARRTMRRDGPRDGARLARLQPLALHLAVLGPATSVGAISFGLWQGWWLAGLWLAATLAAAGATLGPGEEVARRTRVVPGREPSP